MIRAALRDLQFRRRRFAIATLGAGLVFGLGITMSGLSAGFDREVERTVALPGADQWLVAETSAGPFAGNTLLPQEAIDQVAELPGVDAAGSARPTHSRAPGRWSSTRSSTSAWATH